MAWQEVTPINTRTAKGLVSYAVTKRYGARIAIPPSLARETAWEPGKTCLKLFVGHGEHAGMLRLQPHDGGAIVARATKAGGLLILIGRVPELPAREVDKVTVAHKLDGQVLDLTLPAHALAVAPTPRSTAAAPARQVVSVNDKFFDDPKPAKVALAAGTRK